MPKAKVTVTIEEGLIDWVDQEVKTLRFRNRSHGFEVALAKLNETEKRE